MLGDRRKMEIVKETKRPLDKPLFISQKKGAFSPRSLQRLYKHMMRSVGLNEMCSSHSFRRTFITNLITQGIDIKTVSTLAGHSSVKQLWMYMLWQTQTRWRMYVENISIN